MDRRAAEAVVLTRNRRLYQKPSPRSAAYMMETRAAVPAKSGGPGGSGLRQAEPWVAIQIRTRLWELAISPRSDPGHHRRPMQGSLHGDRGHRRTVPDRRLCQTFAPPIHSLIGSAKQPGTRGGEPGHPVAARKTQPDAAARSRSPSWDRNPRLRACPTSPNGCRSPTSTG